MRTIYTFKHKLPNKGEELELAVRKPTRMEIDEADMVYSGFISDCVKRGILTKEMLLKVYKNFDGVMSDDEAKEYVELVENFLTVTKKLEKAKGKKEIETLTKERAVYWSAVRDIESEQAKIFDRTAEQISSNKLVVYLCLLLALKKEKDGSYTDLFPGRDFEEKYASFAEMEEQDWDDAHSILNHFSIIVRFWYYGDPTITEDDIRAYDSLSEYFIEMVMEDEPAAAE